MKTAFTVLLASLFINIGEITCKDKVTNENIDQNTERYLTKSEIANKQNEIIPKLNAANSLNDVLSVYGLRDFLQEKETSSATDRKLFVLKPRPGLKMDSTTIELTDFECGIRKRVLDFEYKPGYFTFPSCIEMNECSGCGTKSLLYQCVPDEFTNITSYVMDITYDGTNYKLRPVTTVQPKSCKQECRVKASDCLPGQVYFRDSCSCSCTRNSDVCPVRKQWSLVSCGCECSDVRPCPSYKPWNKDTCLCTCIPKTCPSKMRQDPLSCNCI